MSEPVAFNEPLDIANRALQRVGQTKIASFSEDSKAADEVSFCYDKLRMAEMRRNVWVFSIRKIALRAFNPQSGGTLGTMMLTPVAWDITKNYLAGSIRSFGKRIYISRTANIAKQPDISPDDWGQYFGPRTVEPYDTKGSTVYYPGELVYTVSGVTPTIFLALTQSSLTPATTPAWVATSYYNKGDTVTGSDASKYQSKIDLNINLDPVSDAGVHWTILPIATQPDTHIGSQWMQIDATIQSIPFIFPVGAGPSSQSVTRNVYFLPYGYLRHAPQKPKAGVNPFLGAPNGNQSDDWEFQGIFFVTSESRVIIFRFAADIADVKQMDAMFCEGLSCRIAIEVCEPLTQSGTKLSNITAEYAKFMGDARQVNGIEIGPIEPPEDDFITCRT